METKADAVQDGADVAAEKQAPSVEERLTKLEGEWNEILQVLDRHGINLPAVASGARPASGATQKVRKLRESATPKK